MLAVRLLRVFLCPPSPSTSAGGVWSLSSSGGSWASWPAPSVEAVASETTTGATAGSMALICASASSSSFCSCSKWLLSRVTAKDAADRDSVSPLGCSRCCCSISRLMAASLVGRKWKTERDTPGCSAIRRASVRASRSSGPPKKSTATCFSTLGAAFEKPPRPLSTRMATEQGAVRRSFLVTCW